MIVIFFSEPSVSPVQAQLECLQENKDAAYSNILVDIFHHCYQSPRICDKSWGPIEGKEEILESGGQGGGQRIQKLSHLDDIR